MKNKRGAFAWPAYLWLARLTLKFLSIFPLFIHSELLHSFEQHAFLLICFGRCFWFSDQIETVESDTKFAFDLCSRSTDENNWDASSRSSPHAMCNQENNLNNFMKTLSILGTGLIVEMTKSSQCLIKSFYKALSTLCNLWLITELYISTCCGCAGHVRTWHACLKTRCRFVTDLQFFIR